MYPLHTDHLLQLHQSKTSERLGEDVRELLTSFNKLDDDLPFIDTVPEEVELYVDVLAPVMEDWAFLARVMVGLLSTISAGG